MYTKFCMSTVLCSFLGRYTYQVHVPTCTYIHTYMTCTCTRNVPNENLITCVHVHVPGYVVLVHVLYVSFSFSFSAVAVASSILNTKRHIHQFTFETRRRTVKVLTLLYCSCFKRKIDCFISGVFYI